MGFLKFGSKIKHRTFEYVPRYYDPDKEELEQRLKRYYREEADNDEALVKERIRGGFRRKYRIDANNYGSRSASRSSKILLATIAILCLLTYVLLTKYLPIIVKALA